MAGGSFAGIEGFTVLLEVQRSSSPIPLDGRKGAEARAKREKNEAKRNLESGEFFNQSVSLTRTMIDWNKSI